MIASKPLTVSVADASKLLGWGRTSIFAALKRGDLVRCKLGRRTLITVASLERLVESSVVPAE